MSDGQRERAEVFRRLHQRGTPIVLCNAWDAGSAKIIEVAGAKAIATSSAALAVAHGYPDGEKIPRELLAAAVAQIVRVASVPVSADIEAGYGPRPEDACETVRMVMDAGAIGINIEDGTGAPAVLAAKIRAVRQFAAARGVPIFINARTDVYLRGLVAEAERAGETIKRIREYAEAGADGAFVPGVTDIATIARLVKDSALPVNVMYQPGLPSVAELAKVNVARISMGAYPAYAALALTRKIAEQAYREGSFELASASATIASGEMKKIFAAIA